MISGTARGAGKLHHDEEGQNGRTEVQEKDRLSLTVLDQQSGCIPRGSHLT